MQYYCSEFKTKALLGIGLTALRKIEDESVPLLYALDPHKLIRSLEDLSMLTYAQIVVQAIQAALDKGVPLDMQRMSAADSPESQNFLTIKMENGEVKTGELPRNFWGNMKEQYEAYNKDYTGVYKGK
jgi:hypothetical protein